MRTIIAVAAAVLLSAAGCRQPPRAGPAPAEAHPLAMLATDGTAPVDHLIGDLQAQLRREPASPETWARLGEAWARRAREAADPGHSRSAADCAEAALALSPGHRRAQALKGLVLLDAHRFDEARRLAEGLLERDPRDLTALGICSDALLELGRFEESVEAAQRMLDLKPSLPSYARASYLMWLRGDVAGALDAARLAIDAGGDREARAWVMAQTALLFWHQGDLDGADAGLDRALAEQPGYPAALAAKGKVALSRGDAAAAVGWLEQAWRRAPLPETAWLLADARRARGDEAGARKAEELVIRAGRALDRRTLALFLATRDRDGAEALRLAEAERATRGDFQTEDALAWALFRAGRLREADDAARRATRLGTPDARLLYHAGAIRLARGDARGGRALIRRALALNPSFDAAEAAEARRLVGERTSASAPAATRTATATAASTSIRTATRTSTSRARPLR